MENSKFVMPVVSLLAVIIGAVMLNDSEKWAIAGGVLLVTGMFGCFKAIVDGSKKQKQSPNKKTPDDQV